MKGLNTLFFFFLFGWTAYSQSYHFTWQAIIRDDSGTVWSNKELRLKWSILNEQMVLRYAEEHKVFTNNQGLITLKIGDGENKEGSLDRIDWSKEKLIIRSEVDLTAGRQFKNAENHPLSVLPYAINSFLADSIKGSTSLSSIAGNGSFLYYDGQQWAGFPVGKPGQFLSTNATGELAWGNPVTIPNVSTSAITDVTGNSAKSGGNITPVGNATITARGVIWSTSPNPTIALLTKTVDGAGTGVFTSNLTGLTPNTTYYVKAYATNSDGTGYGNEVSFKTTAAAAVPILTTSAISAIATTTATGGGNVTASDGATVTARGVVWSTSPNPTIALSTKTVDGAGTGVFTSNLTGLTPNTTYYVKAYATNSAGTGYGNEITFTSTPVVLPTLITVSASWSITTTSATSGGNISSNGGAAITARGVVWSTSPTPTISLSTKTSDGSGTGSFTSSLSGLTPSTTYYVRAYATNSAGTGYGNEYSFTTSTPVVMNIPCPGISSISDIDGNSYNTVQIGTQCWTKENLKVSKYRNGDPIPTGLDARAWSSAPHGAFAIYGDDNANNDVYGKLYNWHAVNHPRKLCPAGWHVPTNDEWTTLTVYLNSVVPNGNVGGKMKSTSSLWNAPNVGADNSSGFTALPGGCRDCGGSFNYGVRSNAFFWSATEGGYYDASSLSLSSSGHSGVSWVKYVKQVGLSVRCLKDIIVSPPTLNTKPITAITSTSATTGGNITTDGGAAITARGVVWSTSPTPTISLSTKTSDGSGTGSFFSSLSGLTPSTTYYVRAYATNSAGTGYGNEITFPTSTPVVMNIPCPGISSISDIDGNSYNTVQIGTQCWTKENLKVSKYRNGDAIPTGLNASAWSSTSSGAFAIYGDDNAKNVVYGKLYNWHAVNDSRKLCPAGWHVPTNDEWTTLTDFLNSVVPNGNVGGKMKSTSSLWNAPNVGADNSSGFTALPGGARDFDGFFGKFSLDRNYAFFWSATEYYNNLAWYRLLNYFNGNVSRTSLNGYYKQNGYSVRCIKD